MVLAPLSPPRSPKRRMRRRRSAWLCGRKRHQTPTRSPRASRYLPRPPDRRKATCISGFLLATLGPERRGRKATRSLTVKYTPPPSYYLSSSSSSPSSLLLSPPGRRKGIFPATPIVTSSHILNHALPASRTHVHTILASNSIIIFSYLFSSAASKWSHTVAPRSRKPHMDAIFCS